MRKSNEYLIHLFNTYEWQVCMLQRVPWEGVADTAGRASLNHRWLYTIQHRPPDITTLLWLPGFGRCCRVWPQGTKGLQDFHMRNRAMQPTPVMCLTKIKKQSCTFAQALLAASQTAWNRCEMGTDTCICDVPQQHGTREVTCHVL